MAGALLAVDIGVSHESLLVKAVVLPGQVLGFPLGFSVAGFLLSLSTAFFFPLLHPDHLAAEPARHTFLSFFHLLSCLVFTKGNPPKCKRAATKETKEEIIFKLFL